MIRILRNYLLSLLLLFAGGVVSSLRAQFYSVQTNTLELATTTFNVEGSMLLNGHWTLNLGVAYNPWSFSATKKIKHWLVEPGARYWFWQPYAGDFISMYGLGARYNVSWGGKYRYEGWGYGAGFSYGRSWLLGKRWNLEAEAGLGLLISPYTKYRCETCGDKVKSGTYYLPAPKLALSLVYLF